MVKHRKALISRGGSVKNNPKVSVSLPQSRILLLANRNRATSTLTALLANLKFRQVGASEKPSSTLRQ
jgi:hypothetical protein